MRLAWAAAHKLHSVTESVTSRVSLGPLGSDGEPGLFAALHLSAAPSARAIKVHSSLKSSNWWSSRSMRRRQRDLRIGRAGTGLMPTDFCGLEDANLTNLDTIAMFKIARCSLSEICALDRCAAAAATPLSPFAVRLCPGLPHLSPAVDLSAFAALHLLCCHYFSRHRLRPLKSAPNPRLPPFGNFSTP